MAYRVIQTKLLQEPVFAHCAFLSTTSHHIITWRSFQLASSKVRVTFVKSTIAGMSQSVDLGSIKRSSFKGILREPFKNYLADVFR